MANLELSDAPKVRDRSVAAEDALAISRSLVDAAGEREESEFSQRFDATATLRPYRPSISLLEPPIDQQRYPLGRITKCAPEPFLPGRYTACWSKALEQSDNVVRCAKRVCHCKTVFVFAVCDVGSAVVWRFPRSVGRVGRLYRSTHSIRPSFHCGARPRFLDKV